MSDDFQGVQLGTTDSKNNFWQFNLGHVMQILMMIGAVFMLTANMVSEFANVKDTMNNLNASVLEMKTWRDRQDMDNMAWKQEISRNFDTMDRRLERLESVIIPNQPPRSSPWKK